MMETRSRTQENVCAIHQWLGLNENPDGDTLLKPGEASDMRNFKITRDGNLQKRPGYQTIHQSKTWTGPIRGIWHGNVTGTNYVVFAAGGCIYSYDLNTKTATSLMKTGTTFTDAKTNFFGFGTKLYAMNGYEYLEWDGSAAPTGGFSAPVGYRPLIAVSTVPSGGGTLLEGVNKLNGLRRVQFSPTGSANIFQLPETGLTSIDYVKNTATGANYVPTTDYTVDLINGKIAFVTLSETFSGNGSTTTFTLANKASITGVSQITVGGVVTTAFIYNSSTGVVTFTTAPASGTNNIVITEVKTNTPLMGANTLEIGYSFPTTNANQVKAMKYAELYNGAQDTRVFIYGDGTNKAYYSGLDSNGTARADYFPDLNVITVGASNTPITGMIRHFSSLVVFKSDSAYAVDYGQITLATGALTAAFYQTAANKAIGNAADGQVQLVDNNPWTLFNSAVYMWRSGTATGALSYDERQALRVSDRVKSTLLSMNLTQAITYDDNERQEYYILQGGTALVFNYADNVWYKYTNFGFTALIAVGGSLYGCTTGGDIVMFSRLYYNDNGAVIDCYWQSGSMSFGRDYLRKYSGMLFVALKPEAFANVQVSIMTDRKSVFTTKTISYSFPTFLHANFAHWGFGTNTKPHEKRLKIKAKKFVYYQLVFETHADWNTATILSTDISLRYGGNVK